MDDVTKNLTLLFAIMLLTVTQFNADIYVPSMPDMMLGLNTTMPAIQLTVVASMMAFGVALFIWGPLSDHIGRRRVALSGLAIFILGSCLASMASTIEGVLVARILQGVGVSCAGAIAPVIPKDIFQGKKLLKAYAQISMAMAAVPMVAQVLGGYLQTSWGWRANFYFLAAYGLVVWFLLLRALPETNPNVQTGPLQLRPVVRQYLAVSRCRVFWGYLLCMTLIYAGEIVYMLVAPFILRSELGVSALQTGWLSWLTGGGLLIGAMLSSRLSQKRDIHYLMVIGLLVATLGVAMMGLALWCSYLTTISLVLPMMLFMLGAGLVYPNCIAGIMDAFPKHAGVAAALMSSLQMLGAGLIDWIAVAFSLDSQQSMTLTFLLLMLVTWWVFLKVILRLTPTAPNLQTA